MDNKKPYVIKVTCIVAVERVFELDSVSLGMAKTKAHTKAIDEFTKLVNCSDFELLNFDSVKAEK